MSFHIQTVREKCGIMGEIFESNKKAGVFGPRERNRLQKIPTYQHLLKLCGQLVCAMGHMNIANDEYKLQQKQIIEISKKKSLWSN